MPATGHFILHSNVMPDVTAGSYVLESSHSDVPFPVADTETHIHVSAPRYTMPPDQILSSFPPANGEGTFGQRLPQIVLKRRTLPWERNPAGVPGTSTTPWLALVVIAEGEGEISEAAAVDQCVTPGTVLLEPTDRDVEQSRYLVVTETVLEAVFPCEEDLRFLTHVREVDINDTELAGGDDDGWLAVVMANRLPVADTANGASVRYTACLVNVEGQLDSLPAPKPAPPQTFIEYGKVQDWSYLADDVVVADHLVMGGGATLDRGLDAMVVNPIVGGPSAGAPDTDAPHASAPQAAASAAAAAAPLSVGRTLDGSVNATRDVTIAEQWSRATAEISAAALDPDANQRVRTRMRTGWHYPIELYAPEQTFRFPVLAHWSFTSNAGASFETLMQELDVSLLGSLPPEQPNDPPPAGPPLEVVATGHIGLGHRTRRGDATRAWYRGPLAPFPVERDEAVGGQLPLAHSADQLRRVVPDGREDLSTSAGFEIGRLLALSQLSVVSALLRFRQEQFGAGRVREVLGKMVPFDLPELHDKFVDLGRFVAFETLGGLLEQPEESIGPRRPIADPGREIKIRGDLDELVAEGLGLDLGVLMKTGDSIGLVAALADTEVPIAHDGSGDSVLTDKSLTTLRGRLDAELGRVLDVAVPVGDRVILREDRPASAKKSAGSAARRRAAPAAARDVLDDLIDAAEQQVDAEEEETE